MRRRTKSKLAYELDSYNRLVARSGEGSSLKRFKEVLEGRFKTDSNNRLYYEVRRPLHSAVPRRIILQGRYSLDGDRNLLCEFDAGNRDFRGKRLRIKSSLIGSKGDSIVFIISSKEGAAAVVYPLVLKGRWQVDDDNRVVFAIKRPGAGSDDIVFSSGWALNRDNQIMCYYKNGFERFLISGAWTMGKRNILRYNIEGLRSSFNIKVSSAYLVKRKRANFIKFEVPIIVKKGRKITREIMFVFKMRHESVGGIALELTPARSRRKKFAVRLTRNILGKSGTAYVESFLRGKERYTGGGIAFRW